MERVRGNHLSSRTRPTRGCDSSRYLAHWAPPAPPAPLSALWMQRGTCPGWGRGFSPPLPGSGLGHPASCH